MRTDPSYRVARDPSGLTARHRQLLRLYATGKTQTEVVAATGLSRQRVSTLTNELVRRGMLVKPIGYKKPPTLAPGVKL